MGSDPKPSLALVVKYFPPMRRISGIIGYIATLSRYLDDHFAVQVVSFGGPLASRSVEWTEHGRIIRVGSPFPVRAGLTVRSLDPDVVLVVSGLHEPWLFVPFWGLYELSGARDVPQHLYQVTLPKRPPPRAFAHILRRYRSLVCASDVIAESMGALSPEVPSVLPPGVDVDELRRVEPVSHRGGFRVGFFNHLNRIKGFDRALTIFRSWAGDDPDVELVIAGTGDLDDEARAAAASDPRIDLRGYLDDATRLSLMASCDVMLLPFRTGVSILGLSQTVLECLALGTVVVGSKTPSIAPAIRDGQDGLLFRSDDEACGHLRSLSTDTRRLASMSETARAGARRFDVRNRAEALAGMLRS